MNKQISTGVWIAIAIAAVVIIILSIWIALAPPVQPPTETGINIPNTLMGSMQNQSQTSSVDNTKQKACLDSGGTIRSSTCCQSASNFPNSCAIGACGCAPTSSHQVKTCDCGEGKCFDGNSCVSAGSKSSLPITQYDQSSNVPAGWKTYLNTDYGFEVKYPVDWTISTENIQPSIKSIYVTLTSPKTKRLGETQGEYPAGDLYITAYQSLVDFNSGANYQTKNLQESLNKMQQQSIIEPIKETSVNGIKAFETNQNGMGSGDYTLYLGKSGGKIYELDFSLMATRKDFSTVENQILASFKLK
jgi:hypothetical protein